MEFEETSVSSRKSENGEEGDVEDLEELLFLDQKILASQQYYPTKEIVLFLVDVAQSMHNYFDQEKTTPLTSVLKVLESYLKTKIIANQTDSFGVVIFNTAKAKNEMNLDGVANFIEAQVPNPMIIKKIKEMIRYIDPNINKDKFKKELKKFFPPNTDNKNYINNALWIAHTLLKDYDKKVYKRRVFLFTDNDDPIKNNQGEKDIIMQRAKDMNDSDILLEIFPMSFRTRFNLTHFYALIIPTSSDEDISNPTDDILNIEQCVDRLKELTKRVRQKEMKKRTLSRCIFNITGASRIYMNIYCNLKRCNKGKMYMVEAKSNSLLKAQATPRSKETNEILYPEKIGTYIYYANKKIKFSKDEMKKIKIMEAPGMTLMGFKSIDSIKPYYNMRESYFIYPNEAISKGSGKLIDALIKQMANKKKCAIVKFVGREGSMVKFCALLPQLERLDEDFFQTPPGLNMIVLPFADDIRSNSEVLSKNPTEMPFLTDRQKEMARKIIKRMNISFDCRAFENVELQRFYSALQALALNEATIDRTEDKIQPHRDGLIKVLAGIDDKYRMSIFANDDNKNKIDNDKNKKKKKGKNDSQSESNSESEYSLQHKKKKHKQKGPKKSKRRIFKYDTSTESELSSSDSIESLSSGSSDFSNESELSSSSDYSSASSESDYSSESIKKTKKNNNSKPKAKNGRGRPPANKPGQTNNKRGPRNNNGNNIRGRKKENEKQKEESFSSSSSSDSEEMERERHREEKRREREKRPKMSTDVNLVKFVRDKILDKMSIEDLKGICSGKGISSKGNERRDMMAQLINTYLLLILFIIFFKDISIL